MAVQRASELPNRQGSILGKDRFSAKPPKSALECANANALAFVRQELAERGEKPQPTQGRAGSWRTPRALTRLFNTAASDVIRGFREIAPALGCPLVFDEIPPDFFDDVRSAGQRGSDVVFETARRLYRHILPR